jgi:glycerol-3-phosphate dehydrogenase subunit B
MAFYGIVPELTPVSLSFSGRGPTVARARALDDRANVDALARELAPKVKGMSGILAPPVLGLARYADTRRWLSEAVGMPVIESLAHLPSVPGVRLQQALEAALHNAGVAFVGEVVAPRTHAQQVTSVMTRDGLELSAAAFVLASGRFVSGGVIWTDSCREALFGLPVVTELGALEADSPHKIVRAKPVESHPLMTAGVKVNRQLQPIREARVAYNNLFAAGMIIGGFASRYALCADGVALATGWQAGQAAAGAQGSL